MKFPKHQYVRSKKLLKLVADLPCQHCLTTEGVQAAHTNWGGGKGRSIKADDNLVAALCQACHFEIDQGKNLTKADRQEMWVNAHNRTVEILRRTGQWPVDVPLPEPSQLD